MTLTHIERSINNFLVERFSINTHQMLLKVQKKFVIYLFSIFNDVLKNFIKLTEKHLWRSLWLRYLSVNFSKDSDRFRQIHIFHRTPPRTRQEVFYKTGVLSNFAKITGKISDLCVFLKKSQTSRFRHRCFLEKFAKLSGKPNM